MVPVATLAVTPYNIGAPQVLANVAPLRGEHKIYTAANARIDDAWTANPMGTQMMDFKGTLNAAGNTIYLPYDDDKITSMRLPVPPPPGVNFFLTANMSGCRFIVDSIAGSNDLVVYHANTHAHAAPPHGFPANFQDPGATVVLNTLHHLAQQDYAPAVLNNAIILSKPAYYNHAAVMEQQKHNRGRRFVYNTGTAVAPNVQKARPEFVGGCSVMGFFVGAAWQFHFQTWGDLDYDRPTGAGAVAKDLFTFHWNSIHKLRTLGAHKGVAFQNMRVVDHAQFL
jgi:hypothetical protein